MERILVIRCGTDDGSSLYEVRLDLRGNCVNLGWLVDPDGGRVPANDDELLNDARLMAGVVQLAGQWLTGHVRPTLIAAPATDRVS